jgi:site-specific DNA recombinase
MQVALYARVSTTRQAENDLSIPDQLRQMRQWAERNGHVVVKEYIEPGASATDDKRPVFQDMMNDAALKPSLFEAVIVHSLSRFFRDLVMGAMYQKTLKKAGVQLISITQQTQNDPSGDMQRHIFMLFDEYQSKEISKHTLRGMQENARQGYFNGAKAPFGYKTVDAGQTGLRGRMKKKLAIEPKEAEVVRTIFTLYVAGINGPRIGMKEIAKYLNAKGILNRSKLWRVQTVQIVLSSTTYAGWHTFNKLDSKTRQIKADSEWVKIPVPAIIDQDTYDKTTKLRDAWSPKKCAPRREVSPNLLMGLLKCGHCGASMSVVTGKGGRYRYYKCNARMSRGNVACVSKNFPLEKIDTLVLNAFKQRIYTPEHIRSIIDELRDSLANNKSANGVQRLKALEIELKQTEQAQSKLFEAVEKGMLELDDQLKERARQNKQTRQNLVTEIAELKRQHQTPLQTLTPQKIEAVSKILARRLSVPSPYSRAYLKASLTEIRITEENLRLSGSRRDMATLIAADGNIDAAAAVPNFIPDWRPLRDSNPCYYRERVMS